jgi:hypothetical protein
MSESFAGITVPEGDPGGVEGIASALTGMAGAVEAAAAQLNALPAGMGSWQGAASVAFAGACLTTTGGLATSAEAFAMAGGVARHYAHDLEHAQRAAKSAIHAAREAQHRIDDAKRRLADAEARASEAAGRAALASTEVFATGLLGTPSPSAQADQSRAEADQAAAEADAARARRDLEDARDDLERAQTRGHEAMDAAKDAATGLAGALGALGGTPPVVNTPAPPPPPKEEHHGFFGSITHAVTHPGEIVDGVKDFTVDTAKGVGDFAVGLKDVAVMGWHLSPVYGAIDPEGQQRELSNLGKGLSYAWHNPAEFGKALIDWKDIVGGHPGRAFGQLLPNIALTVFTAGGGAAAKGAEGAVTVSRLAKGADAVEATADAARGAEGLEAASAASRVPTAAQEIRIMRGGTAPDGSFIPDVIEGDSIPLSARPRAGDHVQRVYGQPMDAGGLVPTDGFAKKWGRSWTPTPVEGMSAPRAQLGLPDMNAGRFLLDGKLVDPNAVIVRHAVPLDGNPGGELEYLIPKPADQVDLVGGRGVTPPF